MDKRLRSLAIIIGVILVTILLLGGAWMVISRRAYPKMKGTVQIDGVNAPVDIYRDSYGVPHIYAENVEDLFFAQGYVHAQDRFWQMEFWRRIGAGRLSEYFGESTLDTDLYLRTMGFSHIAEEEYASSDAETRRILDAYADGVNAYILGRKPAQLGLEFALLSAQGVDIQIEPWTPENTLTWAHVMSQDLSDNMDAELDRVSLIQEVGVNRMQELYPQYRPDFPYIVPDEELEEITITGEQVDLAYLNNLNTTLVGGFDPGQGLAFGKGSGIGSNNWTISGDLTDTGMPLLANDPHLGIQMPSIWYEVGLHCLPKTEDCAFNVRGYSFAGAPGVIIGHNDRIAWGVTNINPDVQDLYIERLNPENINQYEVNGEWVDMEMVYEEIVIQGQDEPLGLVVRKTRHGPVVSDLPNLAYSAGFDNTGDEPQITALALHWTALEPNATFASVLKLDQAQDYDEFREALRIWDSPSQNFVYADVDGNIGYQTPGLIPIRAGGDGSLPVPGWTDDYEWIDFIPFDELPRAFNPEQGYIATANQPVVSDAYPYMILYTPDFAQGYRAKRINDMIQADTDGISIQDIQGIQGDNLDYFALELLPYLEDISFDDGELASARDWLLTWDGQTHMDSPQAALYGYFWLALIEDTFHDDLPLGLSPGSGPRTRTIFYHLLDEPDNLWWDDFTTPGVEKRDAILAAAFERAYRMGVDQFGTDLNSWRWGDVHTATFDNQTLGNSGISIIERIFNRGPVAASGTSTAVNNTAWPLDEPFNVTFVPSMRQIIDLSDLSNSLMMHTTGESGHPGHRFYDNFVDPWRLIEYHPTLWLMESVQADSKLHLRLVP